MSRIVSDPNVLDGDPVIEGTRIPPWAPYSFHRAGLTTEEIRYQYPTLTPEDIGAAIAWCEDPQRRVELVDRWTDVAGQLAALLGASLADALDEDEVGQLAALRNERDEIEGLLWPEPIEDVNDAMDRYGGAACAAPCDVAGCPYHDHSILSEDA